MLRVVRTLFAAPLLLGQGGGSLGEGLQITHGVASGDVTDHSAVIWSRADGPAELMVEVDTDPAYPSPRRLRSGNSAESDFTAHVLLEGLQPVTRYFYRVRFQDASGASSPGLEGTFRTAPARQDHVDAVSLIVGGDVGGQGYCRERDGGYRVFETMGDLAPDFFIANGDMIYADYDCPLEGPEGRENVPGGFPRIDAPEVDWTDRAKVQELYWEYWRYDRGDHHFQEFLGRTPVYVQWDDHEVINDFGAGWRFWPHHPDRDGFPNLVEAGRQALFDYNPIRRNPEEPGRIYRSFRWGKDMELFLIDARSYRDLNDRPDAVSLPKTLLGREQLEWLEEGLITSDATWKIVSSDVPLSVPTGSSPQTFGRDGWANGTANDFSARTGFENELLELLLSLDGANLKNLVFLVTDVHCPVSIRYDVDLNGDGDRLLFHEFISGPLVAGKLPAVPSLDPTLRPVILFGEGDVFNFGYYRLEKRPDGKVYFLADVRDETGAVRPGSSVELEPGAKH